MAEVKDLYARRILQKYRQRPDEWDYTLPQITQLLSETPWTRVENAGLVNLKRESGQETVRIANWHATVHATLDLVSGHGSKASPTPVLENDELGEINFKGQIDTVVDNYGAGARFRAIAADDWGGTSIEEAVDLSAVSTGAGIDEDGQFACYLDDGSATACKTAGFTAGFTHNVAGEIALSYNFSAGTSISPTVAAYVGGAFANLVSTDEMVCEWDTMNGANADVSNYMGMAAFIQHDGGGERGYIAGGFNRETSGPQIRLKWAVWYETAAGSLTLASSGNVAESVAGQWNNINVSLTVTKNGDGTSHVILRYDGNIAFEDDIGVEFEQGRPGFAQYIGVDGTSVNMDFDDEGDFDSTGSGTPAHLQAFVVPADSDDLVLSQQWFSNGDVGIGSSAVDGVYYDHSERAVGILTTSPARTLHVAGDDGIRIAPSAEPSSLTAGDLYIDSGDNNDAKWYDGSAVRPIVSGPSSATDENLAVFDGATGHKIKDGGALSDLLQDAGGYVPITARDGDDVFLLYNTDGEVLVMFDSTLT